MADTIAPPTPAGPDEAATRAAVSHMAQYGASTPPPSLATVDGATQLAMQRGAGAPDAFNASQMGTIQNPYTRANAELATDNAGAAGVRGAINSSTANYLQGQQPIGGNDLQREIQRRTVQDLVSKHATEAQIAEINSLKYAKELQTQHALADPNSMESKLAAAKQKAEWDKYDPNLNDPASPEQIGQRAGLQPDRVQQLGASAAYNRPDDATGKLNYAAFAQKAKTSELSAHQFSNLLDNRLLADSKILDGNGNALLSPADIPDMKKYLMAEYGGMLGGYKETGQTSQHPAVSPAEQAAYKAAVNAGPSAATTPPGTPGVPAQTFQQAGDRAQLPSQYSQPDLSTALQIAALARAHAQSGAAAPQAVPVPGQAPPGTPVPPAPPLSQAQAHIAEINHQAQAAATPPVPTPADMAAIKNLLKLGGKSKK